jgi:cytochrome c-type biogenesis protein CcmF
VTLLSPKREYFSSSTADPSQPLRSFFEGEATSEVGRKEGLGKDIWAAMQPDLTSFQPIIAKEDAVFAKIAALPAAADPKVQDYVAIQQGKAIRKLEARYLAQTPPAAIRFNINPFVIWIWLGAIVGMLGALFALWPGAEARRRRISDVYAARLARELDGTGA